MRKIFSRVIVVLLVPCLIADPVTASVLSQQYSCIKISTPHHAFPENIFGLEAVNTPGTNFVEPLTPVGRELEAAFVEQLGAAATPVPEGGRAFATVPLDGLKNTERIAAAVFARLEKVRAIFNESTSVTARTDAALTIKELKSLGLVAKDYRLDVPEIERLLYHLTEWHYGGDDWNLVTALKEAELFPEGYALPDDFLRALAEKHGDAQVVLLEKLVETGTISAETAARLGLEEVFRAKARDYYSRVQDEAYEGLCVLRQKKVAANVFTAKALKEFLTPYEYGNAYEHKEGDKSSLRRLAIAAYYGLIDKEWLKEIDLAAGLKKFAVNCQLPLDAVPPAMELVRQGLLDAKGVEELGLVPKLAGLLVAEDTTTRAYAAGQLASLKKAGLLPSLDIGRDTVEELLARKKAKHSGYADAADQSGAASLRALESLIEAGLVVPGSALPGMHYFRPYSQLIVRKLLETMGRYYSPLEAEVAARIFRKMLADGDITRDNGKIRLKGLAEEWEAEEYGAQGIRNNLVGEISHPTYHWLDHCRVPARTWQTLNSTGLLAGTHRDKEEQMLEELLKNFAEGYRDDHASFVETLVTLKEALSLHSLADLNDLFARLPALGAGLDPVTAEKILYLVKARAHAGADADESFASVRGVIRRLSGEDAARIEALRHLLHTVDFLAEQGSEAAKEYLKAPLSADARAARDKDVVDAILAKAELARFAPAREAAEHLVRCRIYGEGSTDPAANFLRVLNQTEPGFAYGAFNAVMATNHVSFANFEPVRTLFEHIQDTTNNEKYSRCRDDAYTALERMARRGVLTADNLATVRRLFIPDNYTTASYSYTNVPRNYYFPALLALTDKGILTDATLDTVTCLFADLIAHVYSGNIDDAASKVLDLASAGALTRDNLFLLVTAFYLTTYSSRGRSFQEHLAPLVANFPETLDLYLAHVIGTKDNPRQWPAYIEAAWDIYAEAKKAVTPERCKQLIDFYRNDKAREMLLKSMASWEWEELAGDRLELVIAAGPMAHVALEHLALLTSEHYDRGNPEPYREYLRTVGHILTQVRRRQPQATAYDAPNEDDKTTITRFLMTRYFEPHRLRAVFDVYFNSDDTEVQKHIDDYALKFAKKKPAAFYREMDEGARLVHRRQERKLDYNFFIPFLVNFMEEDGTLAPQAELFFKLFTSKKLHQWRTLKTVTRLKADLMDEGASPETVAHFRKALQVLDRQWKIAAAKGKDLDERVSAPDGGKEYFSFLAARELIDLLALFIDLNTARSKSVGRDVLARDYALEWRPRIMKALDELIAAPEAEAAAKYFRFRNAADQFTYFYKKNKLGVLYDLFSLHVSEGAEQKSQNIRELIRYAASLPVNQDGKTLFDITVDFLRSNQNRPEVVRVVHQALMEEARGTFKTWRYQSPDYRSLLEEYLRARKNSVEAQLSAARIRTAWETNRYHAFQGPGGATYYLGFTDDFSTMMNLGNPYNFGSCQATYRPDYNRGLAGYAANGWNKALVVFDEKGTFVARRVVRLRITGDGEVLLLREGTYGSREHDNMMNGLLAAVAADAGVRYQPDRGYASYTLQLPLWEGHSPWDYSDTYGKQFAQAVGLIYTAGQKQPMTASVTVPLAQGSSSGTGMETVDEEFFRLIADHVSAGPAAAPAADTFVSSVPSAEFVEAEGVVYFRGAPVFPLAPGASLDDTYRPVPDAHPERYGSLYLNTADNQLYMQPALMTLPRNLPYVQAALAAGKPAWRVAFSVAVRERLYSFLRPISFYLEHGEGNRSRRARMIGLAHIQYLPVATALLTLSVMGVTELTALASVAATTTGFLAGGLFQWASDTRAIGKMCTTAA